MIKSIPFLDLKAQKDRLKNTIQDNINKVLAHGQYIMGPEVLEFDVTSVEQAKDLNAWLKTNWGEVDGALHAIGFAPEACLGEDFMSATWDDVKVAMEISAYSFKTLAEVVAPLMPKGSSIVGLDFDARFAWPAYNWMGVAKAALESTSTQLTKPSCSAISRAALILSCPLLFSRTSISSPAFT